MVGDPTNISVVILAKIGSFGNYSIVQVNNKKRVAYSAWLLAQNFEAVLPVKVIWAMGYHIYKKCQDAHKHILRHQ